MQAKMDHMLNQLKSNVQLLKNKEHWPLAIDTILKRRTDKRTEAIAGKEIKSWSKPSPENELPLKLQQKEGFVMSLAV